MDIKFSITMDDPAEALALLSVLAVATLTEPEAEAAPEPAPDPDCCGAAAEKKAKRGRPRKPRVDVVSPALADTIEKLETLDEAPPAPDTKVVDVVGVLPDPEPEQGDGIATGQQLQDYIMSLVQQHRLDPTAVKAKIYPKYGIARTLDLTPEQVPQAKLDVDRLLKPSKAAPNDDLAL